MSKQSGPKAGSPLGPELDQELLFKLHVALEVAEARHDCEYLRWRPSPAEHY
jgi:hypothetical protein